MSRDLSEVPEMVTERLILRAVTLADAPSYQKHFADYRVIRHLGAQVPWPYPEDGVRTFIQERVLPTQGEDRWHWGMRLVSAPEVVIGSIELWQPGTPENRGFWLGYDYWGKGLMTEALVPVMQFAFETAGFKKIVLSNAVGNGRSARIKQLAGAVLMKREPQAFVDPQYTERELWELTKAQWELRR